MTNSTPRFTRLAPDPDPRRGRRTTKTKVDGKLVTVGGVGLPPHQAALLTKYMERFNGAEAARSIGITGDNNYPSVYACETLSNPKVRLALRNALIERRDRSEHKVDDVARHWWSIATADPRELTQHLRVACRHCWGVDHDYQYTDVEQRDRERKYAQQVAQHQRAVERLRQDHPDAELPEAPLFFEGGGAGYSVNRDPMRGPDWVEKMERESSRIGRPLPEWVEANAEHSCPACGGDGVSYVYLADTRYLNAEEALLFDGVRITKDRIEIKTLDRMAAMEKYEAIMGMSGPQRLELTGANGGPIDVRVRRIESRVVDADFVDITERVASGTLPNGRDHAEDAPRLPAVQTGIVE